MRNHLLIIILVLFSALLCSTTPSATSSTTPTATTPSATTPTATTPSATTPTATTPSATTPTATTPSSTTPTATTPTATSSTTPTATTLSSTFQRFHELETEAESVSGYITNHTNGKGAVISLFHLLNKDKEKYEKPISKQFRMDFAKLKASTINQDFLLYYELDKEMKVGKTMMMVFINQVPPPAASFSLEQPSKAVELTRVVCQGCIIHHKNEQSYCIQSFRLMYDLMLRTMGPNVTFLRTPLGKPQLYRVTDTVKVVRTESSRVTVCHKVPFKEFGVFKCHSLPRTEVHVVPVVGLEDGVELNALSICHKDTSKWNPIFHEFVLLKVKVGTALCHFLSTDDLVWVNN